VSKISESLNIYEGIKESPYWQKIFVAQRLT